MIKLDTVNFKAVTKVTKPRVNRNPTKEIKRNNKKMLG